MPAGCRRWMVGVVGGLLLAGCRPAPVELKLLPFADQYAATRPRWLDLGGAAYAPSFRDGWQARDAQVLLTYEATPTRPYFAGTLRATGLKPNFVYQLKLLGRPTGLWPDGDDKFNEWLGRHARWWDYGRETWVDNQTHNVEYARLTPEQRGCVVGYTYFAAVVTDAQGAVAPTYICADRCWHITGHAGQNFLHEDPSTRVTAALDRSGSAYPAGTAPGSVELFLEPEADNPTRLAPLPVGTHSLALLLTEETFHEKGPDAGLWRSVFVSDWPATPSPKTGAPWVASRGTPITITIPPREPVLEAAIVNPRQGEQLAGEVMVQVVADDAQQAEWQIDGGGWQALEKDPETGCWVAMWSTDGKAPHTLKARAGDGKGKWTEGEAVAVRAS